MNKESSTITTITARIPKSVADALRELAQSDGRTINNYLNKNLPRWIREANSNGEVNRQQTAA